jgi:hypothetical protein
MLTEAFFITLHLTLFSQVIYDLFSPKGSTLEEKYRNLSVFFLFNSFLYASFYFHSLIDFYFFSLKKSFFDTNYLGLYLLISIFLSYISKDRKGSLHFLSCLLLSPFVFFLFFGQEKFSLLSNSFNGLQLLKSQNPLLTIIFSLLLLLRDFKIRWFLCILIVSLLGSYVNKRKSVLHKISPPSIYSKYIPSEFFFTDDYLLIEEEEGVYSHTREVEIEEPIYRFTMKPLRYLTKKERQDIQRIIADMEFPIVLKEESRIYIYELYRSYRGSIFKVIYNIESGEGKIEGSLF